MDNGAEKLVSLSNISVSYGTECVLRNINLNIYANDFLGVIGPNGGGKTTLVKTIIGAVPYSGKVSYSSAIRSRQGAIGYLPQQNGFDRSFPVSVTDVVMSGLQGGKGIFGRYRRADKEKALRLLTSVGMERIADKAIGDISGGQMQRALLCRALISDPMLLILDEPANFVDNDFERELYEILKHLNSSMAIIMVSHDLGTISSVVKNIVCVNRTVHRHNSNAITPEQLTNYNCPIQLVSHDHVPHTVLERH